jgi:hypothetical protein
VHPAEQHDVLADILRAQGPARVRASELSERFYLHSISYQLPVTSFQLRFHVPGFESRIPNPESRLSAARFPLRF